jgi:hypothetical protein
MTKPVDRYLQILRIIERENRTGIGVNELVKQTGSTDKQRVINYIRDLERAKIIETKSSSSHQQKKIKNLANLGWDLIRLYNNLELYIDSCSQVRRITKDEFYVTPGATKNVRDRMLRDRGWSSEELNSYQTLQLETHVEGSSIASPTEVINVILTKYIIMLYKFKLKENSIGKLILDKIVMDAVHAQFSIEANIVSDRKRPNEDLAFDIISNRVGSSIIGLSSGNAFGNRFIATKVKQVLKATFSLLDVPNEIISKEIKSLQNVFKNLDEKSSFVRGFKEVVAICEEYMNKSS